MRYFERIIILWILTVDQLSSRVLKKILYSEPYGEMVEETKYIDNDCMLTSNLDMQQEVDAVLFRKSLLHATKIKRSSPKQVWIYFVKESPYTWRSWEEIAKLNIIFNWTITYRLDSTIPIPLGQTIPLAEQLDITSNNMAASKTKLISWLVSHCHVANNRMKYARELSNYIDVDIYGKCGDLECVGHKTNKTCVKAIQQYKFYLAFENTNCKDYITEKLWRNAYQNNVVPIVMGASKENYARLAPPHSYIHVDDFENPEHLAKYIKLLDDNDSLYNQYFEWRKKYEISRKADVWKLLCDLLHNPPPEPSWYTDFAEWWNGDGVCVEPSDNNVYASWKLSKN